LTSASCRPASLLWNGNSFYRGLSATSGPENNIDYLQALAENRRQKPGKNQALAFHFDKRGDQALVSPEA